MRGTLLFLLAFLTCSTVFAQNGGYWHRNPSYRNPSYRNPSYRNPSYTPPNSHYSYHYTYRYQTPAQPPAPPVVTWQMDPNLEVYANAQAARKVAKAEADSWLARNGEWKRDDKGKYWTGPVPPQAIQSTLAATGKLTKAFGNYRYRPN